MKKTPLILLTLGIVFATAFGSTAASWAVTDNADSFGIQINPHVDDHYYLQINDSNKLSMTKSSAELPDGVKAQYEITTDFARGDVLSFYKFSNKISSDINASGDGNNIRYYKDNLIVRSSEDDSKLYFKVKEDNTYDVWGEDYNTEYNRIFLNGGGSELWNKNNPEFYIHSWLSDTEYVSDYSMTQIGTTDLFYADIDAEHDTCIFLREAPGTGKVVWTNEEGLWNKTANLTIPANKDTYTITGWGESDGSWSLHSCSGTPIEEDRIEPTCETDGSYNKVTYCDLCGKQIGVKTPQVIPALGHDWNISYEWNEAHTSVKGTAVCKRDVSHTVTETCSSIESSTLINPTCSAKGTTRYTATFINTIFGVAHDDVQNIPMSEHTWSNDYKHDSSAHWLYCTVCGAEGAHETHHGGQATEQSGASCEDCHYVYTDPLGHTHVMVTHSATQATCTQPGNTLYYQCSGCSKFFSDLSGNTEIDENSWVIPALGHDVTSEWKHDETSHWHQCSRCDYKENVASHTWDGGVVTKEPTYTSKGVMTYTCTVCGRTKTEEIDYLLETRVFLEGAYSNKGNDKSYDYQTQLNSIGDGWYYHDYDLSGGSYIRVRVEIWKNNSLIETKYDYNYGYYYGVPGDGHTTGGVAYNPDNPSATWTKSNQWDNYSDLRYVQKPSL